MKLLLQHRILFGYIILIAVIGSMAAMMFYERNRVQNIEMFISDIRNVEQIITTVYNHRNLLTAFQADFTLTKSETVISYLLWWPDAVRFIKKISSESHLNKLEETDLFTYKTNIYDPSYHGGSSGGIRHQSRHVRTVPRLRQYTPRPLRRGWWSQGRFSHPALCAYPPARIMRLYLERGNAGELYSNSFPAYRHRIYRHGVGDIESLRRYLSAETSCL